MSLNQYRQWQARLLRSRWLAPLVVALTLAVLGSTILLARLRLESAIRAQIAGRDAEVLYNTVQILQNSEGAAGEDAETIEDAGEQFHLILRASRMKGVLAVRLFDAEGAFVTGLPAHVMEARLSGEDLAQARQLRPVSHYHPAARITDVFYRAPSDQESRVPLLEVAVPLHRPQSSQVAGVAQFIMEGQSLEAEFAKLGGHLNLQAGLAFAVGGLVLALALGWAFRRLAERTASLQKANQQLALAARTSALGAVTAHLIHGLKNPLAGLQNFVTSRAGQNGEAEADWDEAVASAQRMTGMINEVVSVLRDEREGHYYELTLADLAEIVTGRLAKLAQERQVKFAFAPEAHVNVSNRTADLCSLILVNLAQNAIQASPAGGKVEVAAELTSERLVFQVRDEGPGLSEEAAQRLFEAGASRKPGGSGIGLAISKQLANHLGAELSLQSNTAHGCCFILALPLAVLDGSVDTAARKG